MQLRLPFPVLIIIILLLYYYYIIIILLLLYYLRSMYRFNGTDGRLRRTCETAVMIMEALQGISAAQRRPPRGPKGAPKGSVGYGDFVQDPEAPEAWNPALTTPCAVTTGTAPCRTLISLKEDLNFFSRILLRLQAIIPGA